jgi:hypothetical protein
LIADSPQLAKSGNWSSDPDQSNEAISHSTTQKEEPKYVEKLGLTGWFG